MKYITEIPDGSTNGETWARRQNWFTQMDSAVSYTNGVIKKAQYGYNGLGKRVKQSTYESHAGVQEDALNPMKNIQYTLDLTRDYYNLLSQEDVLEQKKQRFMWDGNVAGMEEDGVNSYYLQDALGSVVNLVGKDGESMEQLAYEEFGQIRNRSVRRTVQPFAFTGYQMDETSGLYFAQARRYDAGAGRFVSEDKVRGFADVPVTLNHYGYCWNRPEEYIDVDGQIAVLAVIATGVLIGGICGFTGSVISEAVSNGSIKKVNWKNVIVDTVSGAINGGVAAVPGIGTITIVATGGITGIASFETKNALNGNIDDMTVLQHLSGSLFNGAVGAVGNYAGCIAGPKNIHGEVVSSRNIVTLEKAIKNALFNSGKEANKMFLGDVYRQFTKFNLSRTALVNTIMTIMNISGGGDTIQTFLSGKIENILGGDLCEE